MFLRVNEVGFLAIFDIHFGQQSEVIFSQAFMVNIEISCLMTIGLGTEVGTPKGKRT